MRRILAVAIVLLATPLIVFAQASPLIIARDPQGEALTSLPLTITGDATTTSTTFYVRSALPRTTPRVRFSAQLFDETGQRLNEAAFTFTAQVPLTDSVSTVLVDAGTTAITLPSDSGAVRVAVNLNNLAQQGVFTGTLIAEVDGTSVTGPDVVVTRLPAPQLKFNNMSDATSFRLTRLDADFQQIFTITSLNRAPTRLRVDAFPFAGPDGVTVETHWSLDGQPPGTEIDLPGLGTATVVMNAMLPMTGTYTGGLALIYNNQRVPADVIVTRARPALPIEVAGLQTVKVDLGLGAQSDVAVRFQLNETGGQTVTLRPPDLNSLQIAGDNESAAQATYQGVQVSDVTGSALPDSFSIGPGETQDARLTIVGLQGAGEYSGTLRFTGPDYQPSVHSIKILAREGWWAAVFFIALGILLSSGIRYVTQTAQPRLNKQRLIRELLDKLVEVRGTTQDQTMESERAVLDQFITRLTQQFGAVSGEQDTTSEALVKEIEGKLPLWQRWVNLRRRIDVVQPPDLQTNLRAKLDPIGQQLREPSTTDQLKQIESAVQQLDTEITSEVKAALEKQIQALLTEMQGASAPTEMLAKLHDVKLPLDSAQIPQAQAVLEETRQAYVAWQLKTLDDKVKAELPDFVDPTAWRTVQTKVMRQLNEARQQLPAQAEHALQLYRQAYTDYLQGLLDQLQARADTQKANLPDLSASQETRSKLDMLLNGVTSAKEKLAQGNQDEARAGLEQAITIWNEIQGAPKAAGALGMRSLLMDIAGVLGWSAEPAVGEGTSTPLDALGKLPTLAALTRQVRLVDAGLFIFTLVVAVVFGMQTLWLGALTWGGWNDYLIAVLWGLGLHKVAGEAFDGLGWVRNRVKGS